MVDQGQNRYFKHYIFSFPQPTTHKNLSLETSTLPSLLLLFSFFFRKKKIFSIFTLLQRILFQMCGKQIAYLVRFFQIIYAKILSSIWNQLILSFPLTPLCFKPFPFLLYVIAGEDHHSPEQGKYVKYTSVFHIIRLAKSIVPGSFLKQGFQVQDFVLFAV